MLQQQLRTLYVPRPSGIVQRSETAVSCAASTQLHTASADSVEREILRLAACSRLTI